MFWVVRQRGRLPLGHNGRASSLPSGSWARPHRWSQAMARNLAQRLRELAGSRVRNIEIEVRWAEGRIERLAELAAEFVG